MDNSPMLSTPFPETILCDGHSSASGTTAFATCKSLHLNFCRVLPKVSFRYLLVEDKQGTSVVSVLLSNSTTRHRESQSWHREMLPPGSHDRDHVSVSLLLSRLIILLSSKTFLV